MPRYQIWLDRDYFLSLQEKMKEDERITIYLVDGLPLYVSLGSWTWVACSLRGSEVVPLSTVFHLMQVQLPYQTAKKCLMATLKDMGALKRHLCGPTTSNLFSCAFVLNFIRDRGCMPSLQRNIIQMMSKWSK